MKTPEERRRENAQADIPARDGGGQMGQEKAKGGDTSRSPEVRSHTNAGRHDNQPDIPADDSGRTP